MILTTLIGGDRESRNLSDGTYMIGRNETCPIRFDFPDVSERHAILTIRDGKAVIEDLHSANGTYVNGEPIDGAVQLDGGMIIQIGESMMRVCDDGDWVASAAEDTQPQQPAAASAAQEP
jgi:pSer/pThr/pTyr-binding forkhead associated (FHA) protein